MAPTPPTRPRNRRPEPRDRTPERVLALAGVTGLLLVFAVMLVLITGRGGDSSTEVAASSTPEPTATRTPSPTPTPKPKPTPVPLTPAEKAERQAAVDVVTSRGFKVTRVRDYDPGDTLRVLIGKSSSGGRLAFFFVQGDYIGNDSSDLSGRLRVKKTADLTATLTYGVAQPSTNGGAPTTSKIDVNYTWDGSRLSPDQELPPATERGPQAFATP
jgi:LppP/LprE lipoprotein